MELPPNTVIVFEEGGNIQWTVSDQPLRIIVISRDDQAEEEYVTYDSPPDLFQDDQWDPEILNVLRHHLRENPNAPVQR